MHLAPSTAWVWLIACAVVILFFPLAAQFGNLKGKLSSFHTWVWAIALLGIVTAGFMPFTFDTEIANFEVQPFIFFITGTLLGVLFLGQFHRMNAQKKLEHPQRVHAERRTRYSKAVEQLANDKASVRLGGIYTLVGLVDEWLADDTLNPEKRQKEGQVIVNTLCAYIRSPFPLGEIQDYIDSLNSSSNYKDIYSEDNVAVREERDIRQSILKEIQSRLRGMESSSNNNNVIQEGPWSIFTFNFSSALFFYSVDFSNSYFSRSITFLESIFIDSVDFEKSIFKETAIFDSVDFYGATQKSKVSFNESTFKDCAHFRDTTFMSPLYCDNTIFLNDVSFESSGFYTKEPSPNIISFAGAEFSGGLSFKNTHLEYFPVFLSSTQENFHRAKFSYNKPPNSYNFCVSDSSKTIIPLQEIKYKNKTYTIPVGCALFSPDNPSQPEIVSTL